MALRESLADYAERSSTLIESSPQMDEENTKRKLVEPLLELLGWDMLSNEVDLEYSVPMGSGTRKVDYALKLEDTPVVFVEAKGADTTLDESHENQLRSYMRQVGVDWGLLSNGQSFEIFRRDESSKRPNEISLAEFDLDNIKENKQPLTALSKGSIKSGESKRIAENIEAVQQAVQNLRENKEPIAEEVTRVITDRIGESMSQQVEGEAKEFVDSLVTSLEERAHSSSVEKQKTPSTGASTETDGKYGIRILEDGTEIDQVSADTQAVVSGKFVDYLIKNRNLIEETDIPYIPGTGQGSRALVNDEPVHIDGKEMRAYQQLSDGHYLYTSLNADTKSRYLTELAEKLALSCELVGDW